MNISIRKATQQDIPAIHDLVRELAIYEKAEQEFTASVEDYLQDFDQKVFDSIVAELDGEVVGMMLYYLTYSTWKGKMLYLEDFVVRAKARRTGIGQRLFDAFIEEGRKLNCRLTKWQVLDWNNPAIDFYKKNGATFEDEWLNCKVFL